MFARLLSILVLLLLGVGPVTAQDTTATKRGEYQLVVYGGAGLSLYSHTPETPSFLDANTSTAGFCGSLRVMWHPDHLLRLGIETGHTRMYGYTFGDATAQGNVEVSAVPVLLVWSMPVKKRVNLFMGYGYYRITSALDYVTETRTSTWSMGWMAAANYIHPLSEKVGLGGELKWLNATEARNNVFSAQVMLQWRLLRW